KNEHWQSKPHQEQHLELLVYASPASNDAPCQRQEQKWRVGQKMAAEEHENLAGMEPKALVDAPARAQMRQRNPGMLRVPDNRRDGAKREHDEQRIQTGPRKLLSEPGRQGEHEQNRNKLECVRVFGKKSKPNQQSGERPKQRETRTLFQRQPEC